MGAERRSAVICLVLVESYPFRLGIGASRLKGSSGRLPGRSGLQSVARRQLGANLGRHLRHQSVQRAFLCYREQLLAMRVGQLAGDVQHDTQAVRALALLAVVALNAGPTSEPTMTILVSRDRAHRMKNR